MIDEGEEEYGEKEEEERGSRRFLKKFFLNSHGRNLEILRWKGREEKTVKKRMIDEGEEEYGKEEEEERKSRRFLNKFFPNTFGKN